MLPYDTLGHILGFVSYNDLPTWACVSKYWSRFVYDRLHRVYYPYDVTTLNRLCRATKEVALCENYDGNARCLHIFGGSNRITGLFRHCRLENCMLHETVLIQCTMVHGQIRNGDYAFNVETNESCRFEHVIIKFNTKGLINMGDLTMYQCTIEYNNTGIETRGELRLEDCSVKHNSVGIHVSGRLDMEGNDMQNNTINLLRTHPNQPLQRCWTQ